MTVDQGELANQLKKVLGEVAVDLDPASPADKVRALIERMPVIEAPMRRALSALAALEAEFSRRFGYKGVYVMQDPSLGFLCAERHDAHLPFAVLGLQGAQLIYRFTVARRFEVADPAMKQVRINSWGQHVLPDLALPASMQATRDRLQAHFACEPERTARIVALLRQTLTPERASELSMLNANQPVAFLQ